MNPTNVTASPEATSQPAAKRRSTKTTSTARTTRKAPTASVEAGTTRARKTTTSTKSRSKKAQAVTASTATVVESPVMADATTVSFAVTAATPAADAVAATAPTPASAAVSSEVAQAEPVESATPAASSGFFSASRAQAANPARNVFVKPDNTTSESSSSFAQNTFKVFSEVTTPSTSMVSNTVNVKVEMPSYEVDLDILDSEIEQFRAERAQFNERFNLSFVRGDFGASRNTRRR